MPVSNKDTCEATANCSWSSAIERVPTHPFCAPTEMPDVQTLMRCISTPVQDCLNDCTYYAGRVPANETQFHCALINRTATIDNCQNIDTEAMCNNMAAKCEWRPVDDHSNMTDNTTMPDQNNTGGYSNHTHNVTNGTRPAGPTPLFSRDFCHPVSVNDTTTAAEFEQCLNMTNATECHTSGLPCRWSNGTELIPDHDFCAP